MVDISRYQQNTITEQQEFGMGTTTMGVKLDDATRERIKTAATRIDRTPHWLIKQAIFNYLERLESDETLPELPALLAGAANESDEARRWRRAISRSSNSPSRSCRSPSAAPPSPAPTAAETDAVPMLLEQARLPQPLPNRRTAGVSAGGQAAQPENRQRPRRDGAESAAGVFPLLTGRRGADVPGGSAAAYSG
jgi:RHH-type proline utilization regulon transcriptional repressor/proline dehydrogenase/delta 1-pyrroline-5-carboxylate dehydrogenase